MLVSACSVSIRLICRSVTAGVRPFRWPCSISFHGLSLLVSALFRWPCSIPMHLFSPNSLLLGVLNSFLRCVRPLRHCSCPPFSAGHVAFLLSPRSVTASVRLFRWPCSISIHLSPRSATAGVRPFRLAMQHVRPFPLAMEHFYSFVSQVCHCWCPPFSAGHAAFLFICLPGLSLVVSALCCWPCSISIHLSPRSVNARVRPFPLAM